jgi:hypothetical protein
MVILIFFSSSHLQNFGLGVGFFGAACGSGGVDVDRNET